MIFWIFFNLILSLIVEVYLWWITGLSHLFKWENLHNWWLTKYFFAPLYNGMQVSKWHRIVIFWKIWERYRTRDAVLFTESCAGVPLPSTCLCEYECACVNEIQIYEQMDKSLHFKVLPQQIPNPDPLPPPPPPPLPFALMFVVSLASNTALLLPF